MEPSERRRGAASWVAGLTGVLMVYGFGSVSNAATDTATEWLRVFDTICVAARLDEGVFHAQVKMFDDSAKRVPDAVLHMLSPSNTAGYYVAKRGGRDRLLVVMGFTRAGGMESRNCGVFLQSVGFKEATATVADHFPLDTLDQFKQGINQVMIFRGYLAGYPDPMVISVQSIEDVTFVSIFESPDP